MMKVIDVGDDPSSLNGQTDAEANAEAARKAQKSPQNLQTALLASKTKRRFGYHASVRNIFVA